MKKYMILFFSMFMLFAFKVSALENQPILEGNEFYANGYEIIIKKRNDKLDGATIIWNKGQTNVNSNVTIYGGGKPNFHYTSSNIKMISGTVTTIYGGGKGSDTISSNVDTSYINIEGGNVRNAIYGGGALTSNVMTSNIHIKNGIINNIFGGGGASNNDNSVGNYENMHESPNMVKYTNITISNGTITTVYGGGQGYSYVNRASIMTSGNTNIDYLIGGGSNGRTNEINMHVMDGNVDIMQGINKGTSGNVSMQITGGNINNLYTLGDTSNTSVNGKIDTNSNVALDITGGTINNLNPGTNDGQKISNNSNIHITYVEGTIKDISNIKEVFSNIDEIEPTVSLPTLEGISKTTRNNNFKKSIMSILLNTFLKNSFLII